LERRGRVKVKENDTQVNPGLLKEIGSERQTPWQQDQLKCWSLGSRYLDSQPGLEDKQERQTRPKPTFNCATKLIAKMDDLLRPASIIRTIAGSKETEVDFLRESKVEHRSNNADAKPKYGHKAPATPEDALETLRHEPDYDSLIAVLTFLSRHKPDGSRFPSIKLPSPLSAQLVQVLVSEIVPNYWTLLLEDAHQTKDSGLRLLLYCLTSITGVNAILVRLRALIQEAKSETTSKTKRPDVSINLGILLDLLCRLLQGDGWLLDAYRAATAGTDGSARVKPRVQEIVATFGSGRIISHAAEAEEVAKANGSNKISDIWLADSSQYLHWLGRNIAKLISSGLAPEETKSVASLFAKALHLGHSGMVPPAQTYGQEANIHQKG
jgi:telomere length regulation protein